MCSLGERELQIPERCKISLSSAGDEKGSQFKVENPSSGGKKPGGAETSQGVMPMPAEIEVEIRESKGKWRKKSLRGQNESQDLTEDLGADRSQTHPEHQRKDKPLFSRYGRKYQRKSRFVTELTRGEWDECSTYLDLDETQRSSTGEKSDKCPVRGSSHEGVNLKRNQDGHTRERKYYCTVGENSFTPKTSVRHLETHGEQTANTCPICGKSLKWMHGLNRHLRLHTGEKPFKCSKCPLRFSRKDSLLKHQRRHGREIPYECFECGKGFYERSLMLKHQKTHK